MPGLYGDPGAATYKADCLRAIAERLQDRPVEVVPDLELDDYGLTYEQAEAAQAELLADLEALADDMDPEGAAG